VDEDDTTITSKVRLEINSGGYETELHEVLFRMEANEVTNWAADTVAAIGAYTKAVTIPNANVRFECTARAGDFKTGATEPTWDTTVGNTTVDDQVTWTCRVHTMKFSTYQDGSLATDAETHSLQQVSSELAKRHRFNENISGDNLAVEFKNDTINASMRLFDVGLNMKIIKWQ
jgi:hypothetical protein